MNPVFSLATVSVQFDSQTLISSSRLYFFHVRLDYLSIRLVVRVGLVDFVSVRVAASSSCDIFLGVFGFLQTASV